MLGFKRPSTEPFEIRNFPQAHEQPPAETRRALEEVREQGTGERSHPGGTLAATATGRSLKQALEKFSNPKFIDRA